MAQGEESKIVYAMTQFNDSLEQMSLQNVDAFTEIARTIGGMGALVTLCGIMFKFYFGGTAFDYESWGRIFTHSIGIAAYSSIVMGLNGISSEINKKAQGLFPHTNSIAQVYEQQQNEKENKPIESEEAKNMYAKFQISAEKTAKNAQEITSELKSASNDFFGIQDTITNIVQTLLLLLSAIAIGVLNIIRTSFMLILSLLGVISLGANLIFPGSFQAFVQKYLSTSLWLGVAYIIQGVMGAIMNAYNSSQMSNTSEIMLIVICFVNLLLIGVVPSMTTWFIAGSTGNQASKVKSKISNLRI